MMEPREQLLEAVSRVERLVGLAVGPARRDGAALASEAPPAKAARAVARARRDIAETRARRLGWVPFLGSSVRRDLETAEAEVISTEAAWASIMRRARVASDVMDSARRARACLSRAAALARGAEPLPGDIADRAADLAARAKFLTETEGRESSRFARLGPRALALAEELATLVDDCEGTPQRARPAQPSQPSTATNVPSVRMGRKTQLALDFDGTGEVEPETRIWLPVSASRTRELIERGARVDRTASRRGSQLWVPLSERAKFEPWLPLAFRQKTPRFAFPPIRHNGAKQNVWSMFTPESWKHIAAVSYDRAGHRCQICGKQGGGLWSRIATPDERARGRAVECHEVWDWTVSTQTTGVQSLKRLLVLCPDCHLAFHDGFALSRARGAGIETQAEDYLRARRMLMNHCDGATLDAQIAADSAAWEDGKQVERWVVDLAHLAVQDFMADHTMVLRDSNPAGVTPEQVGGIEFRTEDGTQYAATDARALASGMPPRAVLQAYGRTRG
jgi:hypothetical protein